MMHRTRERGSSLPAGLLCGGLLALAVLSIAAVAYAADFLYVVQRETSIRRDPRTLSPAVAKVRETNQLTKLGMEGSWYRVEFEEKQGWILKSAVSDDDDIVFSGEAVAQGVVATQQAEAGRGFNPKVEKQYRTERPQLNEVYEILNAIEKHQVPEDGVRRFLAEGKLGNAEVAAASPGTPATSLAAPAPKGPGKRATAPWKN